MTRHYGEYDEKPCPYCGEGVKVYANHLPCDGVEDTDR